MIATKNGCGNNENSRKRKVATCDETHKKSAPALFTKALRISGRYLEELLRRKQSYLLAAFLDEAANPVEHACLGLRLMGHSQGIKLVVKRSVSRCGGDCQSRINLC